MHLGVHCNVIYNSQNYGNNLSTHGWMNGLKKRGVYTHIHNGILFGHKKNEIFPSVTTYTDLKNITLYDISQRKTKAT